MKGSGGLFDKLLKGGKIFKNKEYLRPTYIPDELPHRGEQVNQLARMWVEPLRGEAPSNVLIYGKPGSGKTATVKYLMGELKKKGDDVSSNIEVIYINCEVVHTRYRILANITNSLRDVMRGRGLDFPILFEKIPRTGIPTDQVYKELLKTLDLIKQVVIVVLDEVDRLLSRGTDDVLYILSRVDMNLGRAKTGIVGISNDLDFLSELDPRILSSLGEKEVIFPPYNASQLEDILNFRAEMSFCDEAINESVIRLCAAHAAREHGDARRALDLLRSAGEVAEDEGSTRLTTDHVKRAHQKLERGIMEEAIRTLPRQHKLVLLSILLLEERGARRIGTGDIYGLYRALCRQTEMNILTERRVTELISDLKIMGIINVHLVSRGRYGRTKEVELKVEHPLTRSAIEDEFYLKDLDSISFTKQTRLG